VTKVLPHDAQKTLSDLREHLARHDKPIAFLFGAGTSCSVIVPDANGGSKPLIPAVPGLTAECKKDAEALGEKYAKAWGLIEDQCKDAKQPAHVESILTRLRMMLSAIGKGDTLVGLTMAELRGLEESVRGTIARLVTPDLSKLPGDYPHGRFARWLARTSRRSPVEIFTVNYDVLIEHAIESARIPLFDGFVGAYQPFFHADSLRRPEAAPGATWCRLWKMHGSVTWRRIEREGRVRIVRGDVDSSGEMILPSFQKYDESRQQPYVAFTDRLARFLEQDDALLIAAGFSFTDEHINDLIFAALENRPRTHVYALQFDEPSDESALVGRARQRSNLIVIAPKSGVIGAHRAKWAPAEGSALLDSIFEVEEAGGAKTGVVRIGDFARLCRFLESMTAS